MNWKVITPPQITPVTLEEVKAHLKVTGTDEDSLLTIYVEAATNAAQAYTNIRFINTDIEEVFEDFHEMTYLRFPTQAIESIEYDASDDTVKTVDTDIYVLNTYTEPQVLLRQSGKMWPTDLAEKRMRIRVRYTAGFGEQTTHVPSDIRSAILLIVGHLYENREDSVSALPKASTRLLEPWRVYHL
jgi:uncharacterized phiE125 gp8 family phage protein